MFYTKIITVIATSFVVLFLQGCAAPEVKPEQSQLQIREFQSRTFETKDTKMVLKAMLNVLQDDGFIVKNADADLGLLTATKEVDVTDTNAKAWSQFGSALSGKPGAAYRKNSIIEASANISGYGSQTKVRINFQKKVFDNKGGVIEVAPIVESLYYQAFFAKVDKGVFLQKENL
jgi:hypothetical protein